MKTKDYAKKLLVIAVPIMLSNLIGQLQMLIDKIFLGRLDIIYMSAVGNATAPMWTTMSTIFTLTMGTTILVSQAVGEGNDKRAYELTCSMFKYNNVLGIVLFVFWFFCARGVFSLMGVSETVMGPCITYARCFAPVFIGAGLAASVSSMLQNAEKTKALIVYSVVRSGLNIFLDYAMIFGKCGFPQLGIMGAALATTIAEYAGDLVVFAIVIVDHNIRFRPQLADIMKAKLAPFIGGVKKGIPAAAEDFCWNFGNIVLISLLNIISDAAAGIYTIVFSVELVPVTIVSALGSATLTLAGQETGKGNPKGVADVVRTSMIGCVGLAAFILVVFILFPTTILGWFTTDQEILVMAITYLIIVGIDLFPKSGNIIVGSGIRGYGDTRWMFYTQIFGTVFVVSMAAIMIFVFHAGIAEMFCVVVADETLRVIINFTKLRRIKNQPMIQQS